jgi:valyl-tRNA synthetase
MGAPGTDITVSDSALESYKFFATKIWNAARFMFQSRQRIGPPALNRRVAGSNLSLADRWILARLARATQEVRISMEQYHLHEATRTIYRFFWDEFCSWYLEMVKLNPEESKATLLYVFESALRLLHPFMPFITEELWQSIPHSGESIVIAPYPNCRVRLATKTPNPTWNYSGHHYESSKYPFRSECRFQAERDAPHRADDGLRTLLKESDEYIRKLAHVSEVTIGAPFR